MCHIKLSPTSSAPPRAAAPSGLALSGAKDAPPDLSTLDAGEVPEDLCFDCGRWGVVGSRG
jgi:hypothetical protein